MTDLATRPRLADHWRWRPDWHVDRPYLVWYLTCEAQPLLHEAVQRLHDRLQDVSVLDLIPAAWLHLTVADVGFVDELSDAQVDAVLDRSGKLLGGYVLPSLHLPEVTSMQDALVLRTAPEPSLDRLRALVRTATTEVLGVAPVEDPGGFEPHVSIAYVNEDCEERDALAPSGVVLPPQEETALTVSRVTLAAVTRRGRHYQWTERGSIDLAG